MMPCSTVSVSSRQRPSSAATLAIPFETPKPRLTTAPGNQLEGGAARDHLADVELEARDRGLGRAQLAGIGRAVGRPVGLGLAGGHDDIVDHDARDLDQLAGQRARGRDPLDLGDHDPAPPPGRGRDRKILAEERLALHREVAALVRGGRPDHRDVDRERLVEQDLLAAEGQELDQVVDRTRALPAAAVARVDEAVQTGGREQARAAGRHVAHQLRERALGQGVGLDPVGERERREARAIVEAAADHPPGEPGLGQKIEAGGLPVTERDDADQGQVARRPLGAKARRQRLDHRLRHGVAAARAAEQDRIAGAHQTGRHRRIDEGHHPETAKLPVSGRMTGSGRPVEARKAARRPATGRSMLAGRCPAQSL